MATDIKTPLTSSWVEVASGPVLIVLVSGNGFWAYNGASAPTTDADYIPIAGPVGETFYSYPGTEKTYVKLSEPVSNIKTVVSVTPII